MRSGSSGSKVATFQYKCSKGKTHWQLRLKVATFQYKCSTGNALWGTACICWVGQASGCRSDVVLMSFWLGVNRGKQLQDVQTTASCKATCQTCTGKRAQATRPSSSGWKAATFQYKRSAQTPLRQLRLEVATCQEMRSTQSMKKGLLPLGCCFGCRFHIFCYWRAPQYQVYSEAGRPHFAACVKKLGR